MKEMDKPKTNLVSSDIPDNSNGHAIVTDLRQVSDPQFIEVNGNSLAYRLFGNKTGTPLIFLQHFTGQMMIATRW
jgi:hypothetical protein